MLHHRKMFQPATVREPDTYRAAAPAAAFTLLRKGIGKR